MSRYQWSAVEISPLPAQASGSPALLPVTVTLHTLHVLLHHTHQSPQHTDLDHFLGVKKLISMFLQSNTEEL